MFNKPLIVDIVDSATDFVKALRRLQESQKDSSNDIEDLINTVKAKVLLILMNVDFDKD